MNKLFSLIAVAVFASGCTRIETGEVGLRVGFDKQVSGSELMPGSFNQTVIGDVLTFSIREISVAIDNKTPMASDNSTLKDFDMTLIYSVNPQAVSDLWTTKSRAFHGFDEKSSDWVLMYRFMENVAGSAIYKAVRKYPALEVADKRQQLENEIKILLAAALTEEKLDKAITVSQIQIRNILPADSIVASANAVVTAQNDFKAKEIEVRTAGEEAKRIAALNSNAKAIEYMNAQAQMKIAEGIAAGKVHTIVVPYDFKGIVNVK